jgi:Tfp pilus assembly protein PilN
VKPITLNLASRPFRNNTLTGTLLGVAGAAIVVATIANLYVYLSYGQSYAKLLLDQAQDRARLTQLEAEEKRLAGEVRARDFRRAFERGKLASELIRKSAFSWTLLFNTLEAVVPPDVVMTAIRPNISAEGIIIRIEGVAKQHMALLTFEEKLLRHPAFSKVFPSNERQLNPSLPDITFLLTCDYLPEHAGTPQASSKDAVASAPAAGSGAAGAEGAAATAAGTGAAGVGGQEAAAQDGAAARAAGPIPVAGATVGRDGKPRDPRVAGRTIIAPGAILLAATSPAAGTHASAKAATAGSSGKSATSHSTPAGEAGRSAADRPDVKAPSPPAPATTAANTPTAPPGTAARAPGSASPSGATPAGAAGVPPAPGATPPPPAAGVPPADANDPRNADQRLVGAHGPHRRFSVGPAPAQRLDIPLNFDNRTVAEIYDRMGRAYMVRFDLDPIVDRQRRVTLNLQGRKLEDAVILMGGMAHHLITRVSAGVYRVSPAEKGMPIGDAPVTEEPLHPGGKS